MHNILNPLYNYAAQLIIEFFKNQQIKPGDRYNLYLEEKPFVGQLYDALLKNGSLIIQPFSYKHPSGNQFFKSYTLLIDQTKVLIASSEYATEDYFTMLRNNISEQTEGFENTALFIIYSQKLESISGGSESLEKEGMPLHYLNFRERLENDINANDLLQTHEKGILKSVLQFKTKSVIEDNNSIFDYETVVHILNKGKIDLKDYSTLGLFPHAELPTKSDKIEQDIENNYRLYEEIETIFLNGEPEKDLRDRIPGNKLSKFIKEDNWKITDFSEISKWLETEKNKTVPEILNVSCNNEDVVFWKHTDGNSSAKKRKYNCLLFNHKKIDCIKLEIKFDQFTKKEGIRYRERDLSIEASGHNLKINLPQPEDNNIFHIVEYQDPTSEKKYSFKIFHFPFQSNYLAQFETNFLIKSSPQYALTVKDDNILLFNEGAESTIEEELKYNNTYRLTEKSTLKLNCNYATIDEEEVTFNVTVGNTIIPFHIKPDFEPPKLIKGLDVWKKKRIHRTNFKFKQENEVIKIQLTGEQQERTVSGEYRKNLLIEKTLVASNAFSWAENSNGTLTEHSLELNEQIQKAFNAFRDIFRTKNIQPSLSYLNANERSIAENYVTTVLKYINDFPENEDLSIYQKNVFQLGIVRENSGNHLIKLSPFHPLNVAYQLYVNSTLQDTDIYNAILERLTPDNLLPYIEGPKNEIYVPTESTHSPEWTYYSIRSNAKQGVSKSFAVDLIATKLNSFTFNYSILFSQSHHAPLRINAIHLGDCKEVLQGIVEFYRKDLNNNPDKRLEELLPIEVFIYGSENLVNKFEELTFYQSISDVEEYLDINLKTNLFDKEDLLNTVFEKVSFFSRAYPKEKEVFEYAHITFYQFDISQSKLSYYKMDEIKTGLSLNGLLADVSYTPSKDIYRTCFGTKHLNGQQSFLTELSIRYNALARVAWSVHPYESKKVLCSTINYNIRKELQTLYTQSHWVTYIDPRVDLDFFKDDSDLVIVHYSDQYTNSSGYDAITVSRKTDQYTFVIREFLANHEVNFETEEDVNQIINFFNAINGDWLLRLVRHKSHFPKEKLSLLSGIKTALTFLYHRSIIWVPISLEEILRVSGNVGLRKEEGLFSTKNLGGSGLYSDDLLMIGLEQQHNELVMHFYPVELKIGGLNQVNKGKLQGEKTAELIHKHLSQDSFTAEFYKNFFAKLVLTYAEKMKLFHIWDNQQWDIVLEDYRTQLISNQFTISRKLQSMIGDYGLIYFGNNTIQRTLKVVNNCMHIDLLERDGYNFLVKSVDDLLHLFQHTKTTIDISKLLVNTYRDLSTNLTKTAIPEISGMEKGATPTSPEETKTEIPTHNSTEATTSAKGIKILFGIDLNTQNQVIWEPNNSDKVMHTNTGIIGTMGTGKTQFTKSMITQLFQNTNENPGSEKLGILIFDYKGDYVKDDFVQATNAKIFEPHKLPYNPLALDVSPNSKPMLPLHTANDIKETISNAFNLGNIQKQKLRNIIVEAYESKGIEKGKRETWAKTPPTLNDAFEIYLNDSSIPHDSLYAAISNLTDFEIFESNPSKTQSLYSLIEGVVVINLSGYDESIQNLIVAITLDAFYTQMQRHGHSVQINSMRQLRKFVLVDEADNFLSKNFQSLKKILKEGREFGVGTILSTQFLNHFVTSENEYSNYILTWVIHRVNELKLKEVESLFTLENKTQKDNLLKIIKELKKHQSVVNLAGSEPIIMKDKPFWELIS